MSEAFDPKVTPWLVDDVDFPNNAPMEVVLKFLLRYAVLAPSSHNTQPWKFGVEDNAVLVYRDESRWLIVSDPDQRELLIGIGCAIENLLVAAEHFGYAGHVEYFPDSTTPDLVARVRIVQGGERSPHRGDDLFAAIPRRQTNHNQCEPRPVPQDALDRIKACCDDDGITLTLQQDADTIRNVDALVIGADAALFADPYYRDELAHWIGQGVTGASWLMAKLGQLAVSYLNVGSITTRRDSMAMISSPVFGLIGSQRDDAESHVRIGQIFERIYLTATALGLAMQPMSQMIEVAEIRVQLAALIPEAGAFVQQPFRLGYAEPPAHHTPRRPMEEVMVIPHAVGQPENIAEG